MWWLYLICSAVVFTAASVATTNVVVRIKKNTIRSFDFFQAAFAWIAYVSICYYWLTGALA